MSMSSSVSSVKKSSRSWFQSVFDLLPSSVYPSEFWWLSLSSVLFSCKGSSSLSVSFSSLLYFILFLYFRFHCTTKRTISRCVDRINLSFSRERDHVPARGVCQRRSDDHMLNKRSRYEGDVNSCLHLVNDAQTA